MSRLFQIYENDLQVLEHALPRLHDALGEALNRPDVQVMLEEVKDILSNVRWNYGPHTNVQRIAGGDDA
jgi:hypothetical protein